jgi:nucleoside-diphosphate-sugar epimerase
MNKVLLIGGAGYIGGLTTDVLLQAGNEVTVYDNILYESRYLKKINFIYGDIRDTQNIMNIVGDYDVVVIMAALVGDPACSVNPFLAEEINYLAVKNLCEQLPKDKHVVFMSTCSVYGAQDGILTEESPTNPLSVYASTKLDAEKYVLERGGTVFRLGTVFGLGDTYSRIRLDLVVNVLTMRALVFKNITINGGEQWRPIIAVEDIANYVTESVESKIGGLFILSYQNITMRDLGSHVANYIIGTEIHYTDIAFQDARNYRVDNSKSLRIFGYKPHVTIYNEMDKIIKIFNEKRIKNAEDLIYNNGGYIKELYKNGHKI